MSRLRRSVDRATELLIGADLADDAVVADVLAETSSRRRLDLSDLDPAEQAALAASRSQQLQPSVTALAERIVEADRAGRRFVAKFGIDPTGAEVHLGHVVPMLVLSRFQRMGHHVVFIVGDLTAKIGDPTGRSDERPALTDEVIATNLATYRQQVAPFFDFDRAEFRHNGDWLRAVTLPRLVEITSQIPLSMSLQRDDFRRRLQAGQGLSVAELLYSVVMALDSVETACDIELGGIDQFLNMQMCRKVMDICGQAPELVLATALVEGTDGTGAKMSKSRGNYVALTAAPDDVFGKVMSIPDRLVGPWFRALSEWDDTELEVVDRRLHSGTLHPMDLKKILAGEITAAIHGPGAAAVARQEFGARFSRRTFNEVGSLPEVPDPSLLVVDTVKALGFAKSNSEVRRVASQRGLRLVVEAGDLQDQLILDVDDLQQPLSAVMAARLQAVDGACYLKFGRRVARIGSGRSNPVDPVDPPSSS